MNDAHYDIVKRGCDAITKWRAEHTTDILDLSGADLRYADLRHADLSNADLMYADLSDADLRHADLTGADLSHATLQYTDLRVATLRHADLRDATLCYADLMGAYLRDAGLSGADLSFTDLRYTVLRDATLRDATLRDAILRRADLRGVDLRDADLRDVIGNGREIKTVLTNVWIVTYTADIMQIDCQRHAIKDWWGFDDTTISDMTYLNSKTLEWWRQWKPILRQIIVTSPATQTNNKED